MYPEGFLEAHVIPLLELPGTTTTTTKSNFSSVTKYFSHDYCSNTVSIQFTVTFLLKQITLDRVLKKKKKTFDIGSKTLFEKIISMSSLSS